MKTLYKLIPISLIFCLQQFGLCLNEYAEDMEAISRSFEERVKKVPVINITDEDNLHKTVKDFLLENDLYEQSITLVQAPPDIVLEVARQSALLQAATPINPSDDVIHRNILRSGDYWNDVVEEPVNTDLFLRSKPQTNINSLHLRFQPGSNLYDLVTELKKISPRLLYVINDDSE
ncbi:uncharacterized protein LOC123720829 isoform X5 [Pieris brassicae]|uniref:uncharacterized protein LOC123720829 isoform X5 n=1 Tax=Pieris brassicae TaxID=7116 RepID=UPI001E65F8C9|nr:uncharacterized protein LOC123720829 isoform X5 [Pieris brassicae]